MKLTVARANLGSHHQGRPCLQAVLPDRLSKAAEVAGIYLALAVAWAVFNVIKRFGPTPGRRGETP